MKKVLHIPNYYYPHIGGIEQTAQDIVESLKDNFMQKVICFKDSKKTSRDYVNDIEVTRVGCEAKLLSQSIALNYYKELKNLFKTYEPDIVIFHYPNPFVARYLLKLLKKYKDTKLILYWHLDITKQKVIRKVFETQNKKLLKRADRIIATSNLYLEGSKYLSQNKDKVSIINSCYHEYKYDIDKVRVLKEKIKEDNLNKKIIFSFGRLVSHKGFNYLIDVAKILGDDYMVYVGGSGPMYEKLEEKSSNVKNFKLLGRLDENNLEAYMQSSNLFAFTSYNKAEAFGLALAEALAHGLPCVTFKVEGSGINFVSLNNVTGFEVENQNPEKFSNAIKEILSNPLLQKRFSEEALKRSELFNFKTFNKNINELMESYK
jgi:glycosyltransferase involved in cell wall biosynthesis